MKTPIYKKYANARAIGILPLCNFGGLEILETEYNCGPILACFNFGEGRTDFHFHNVHYSESGRAYIRKCGRRYFLDLVMRV